MRTARETSCARDVDKTVAWYSSTNSIAVCCLHNSGTQGFPTLYQQESFSTNIHILHTRYYCSTRQGQHSGTAPHSRVCCSPVLMDTMGAVRSSFSPSAGMLQTLTIPSPPPVARLFGQNGSHSSPRTYHATVSPYGMVSSYGNTTRYYDTYGNMTRYYHAVWYGRNDTIQTGKKGTKTIWRLHVSNTAHTKQAFIQPFSLARAPWAAGVGVITERLLPINMMQ